MKRSGLNVKYTRAVGMGSAGFLFLIFSVIFWLIGGGSSPASADLNPVTAQNGATFHPSAAVNLYFPIISRPPLGGQVHGLVIAIIGDLSKQGQEILIPDVKVHLNTYPGNNPVPGSDAVTNFHGFFMTQNIMPGDYVVCVEATGFAAGCDSQPVTIHNATVVLDHNITIRPDPGFIRGQVLLQDGQPCYNENQFFRTLVWAKIFLRDAVGTTLAGPINANSQGYYVLPHIPGPGPVELVTTCDAATLVQSITLTSSDLIGLTPLNIPIPHSDPQILATIPTLNGKEVRRAAPGDTLQVNVSAQDPNGEPLHYRWGDQDTGLIGADSSSINWTLSAVPASNVLYLQVRNDHGGFAADQIIVQTGVSGAYFQGQVTDFTTGLPIPGAEISINGKKISSGFNGNFSLTVPDADRYVLNAHKPGYALRSQVFTLGTSGLHIILFHANRTVCQPTSACSGIAEGKRTLVTVSIPPNSLVDPQGNPPTGMLAIDSFGFDLSEPNAIPGDYGAFTTGGSAGNLNSYAAASIEITDAAGTHYTLAPGHTAMLSMKVDADIVAAGPPPAAISLWEYDEGSGMWKEQTTATYNPVSQMYTGSINGFSAWNADSVFTNTACIAVQVKDVNNTNLAPPFPFRLVGDIPASPGLFRHTDFTVTSAPFAIYRLPPGVTVTITLHTNSGPDFPSPPVFSVNSGTAIDPIYEAAPFNGIPPDYALQTACHGSVVISLPLPPHDVPYLSVPSQPCDITSATACDSEAIKYYQAIGALDGSGNPTASRGTFNAWKTTNGFSIDPSTPALGEVEAIYYNNGDLQFGRDMHCKKNGANVACYVTNYSITGGPGGPDQAAIAQAEIHTGPIATVAMEYNASAATNPVRFYAYKADLPNFNGTLFKNPALDSEGPKFLPWLCMACHGGSYTPAAGANPARIDNASFLPFDSPTFKQDLNAASIFSAANQIDAFRALNSLVRDTSPNIPPTNPNDPIRTLIDGWYAWCGGLAVGGCDINDSLATRYIPPGWAAKPNLYQEIPRVYCRTCHVAQNSGFPDWTQLSSFTAGFVGSAVCSQHVMPHAEVPFKRFWLSTDPHAPAYLADVTTGINIPGGCPP